MRTTITNGSIHTGQITRVHNPILASFDASCLGLDRYSPIMAVLAECFCLGQVFFLFIVTHVHHDGVKWQIVGYMLDLLPVLRMIEVSRDRNRCRFGCRSGRMDQ